MMIPGRANMSQVDVTIENSGDIQRLLQTLPQEIFVQVQQVLTNGTIRLAERVRELAPVRTGHLLARIYADLGEMEDMQEAFAPLRVVADTDYASYVEFGTNKMAPRPFMGPAVDEVEPEILAEVDAVLDRMIPRAEATEIVGI